MLCLSSMSIDDINAYIQEHKNDVNDSKVEFEDGFSLVTRTRRLVFHMFFWRIMKKWKLPITKKFFWKKEHVDMEAIDYLNNLILQEVVDLPRPTIQAFKEDIWNQLNDLMNFITENCQAHHGGIDIIAICELALHPEMKAITDTKIKGARNSIKEAEIALKDNFDKIGDLIQRLRLPNNSIKTFANLKFINKVQIAHIMYQIGFRSDISDKILPYSITNNYLTGLKNLEDMVFEALSAKKAIFYNKMSIPDSQYSNRSQHLLSATLPNLYKGDCGTTMTLPTMFDEKTALDFLHKWIVVGNDHILLTRDNVREFIGKPINLRSPLLCLHNNGTCEVCGGRLLSLINPKRHLGMISAMKVTNVVVQMILSSKHFQTTNIVEYKIPPQLKGVLTLKHQRIFFRPMVHKKIKGAQIGIPIKNVLNIVNMNKLNAKMIGKLSTSQFGGINQVIIRTKQGPITDLVDMISDDRLPMFSQSFINYIKSIAEDIETDDEFMWIPLKKFVPTDPLFEVLIENDSMVKFVGTFSKFLKTKIRKYSDLSLAFEDFRNIINKQVHINIAYIEMILKNYLTTDDFNTEVPVVTDIHNVRFSGIDDLNFKRSIGATLAYEQLHLTVVNPTTYLRPRMSSEFDNFLNLKEIKDPPKNIALCQK